MDIQVDTSPTCILCRALSEDRLDEAERLLSSTDTITDICRDTSAVYLLVKLYSQFLTEFAQQHGQCHSNVCNADDVCVIQKRRQVSELLKQMFRCGCSANTNHGEDMPLLCAVGTHDELVLKILLENGADPNKLSPTNKMNAVSLAIILNDEKVLKLLLSHGAKVNEPCCQRLTPLQLSMNKSVDVSKVLLQNGADVQQVMQMRGSNEVFITSPPLIHAVETNNLYLASILLEHGEDVNQWYGACTNSPIHFAIQQGNNDMLKLMIQHGANLNKRNGRGHTPLGLALHSCDKDKTVSDTLLAAGCSKTKGSIINVFQRHFPPLHIAAFLGSQCHFEILRKLIEKSKYIQTENSYDEQCSKMERTGKQCISNSERAVDLEKQAQQEFINTQALDKSTALYMAVLGGNLDIVQYLVDNGADPYLNCWHGNLLHAAVMTRRKGEAVLKFVLQFKLDIDMLNEDGNTCLILAARNNTPTVCTLLIENGALLNVQDGKFGETALSASVYFGFEGNAEMLVSYGACPDLPDFRYMYM